MTPADIRSLYVETLARALAPVTEPACCDECTHDPIVHGYLKPEDLADALATAGLLPTSVEGRCIGRGTLRRTRLVTDWKEPEQ